MKILMVSWEYPPVVIGGLGSVHGAFLGAIFLITMPQLIAAAKDVPMRVFHGADDTVVPPESSVRLVERLRAVGADVEPDLVAGIGEHGRPAVGGLVEAHGLGAGQRHAGDEQHDADRQRLEERDADHTLRDRADRGRSARARPGLVRA